MEPAATNTSVDVAVGCPICFKEEIELIEVGSCMHKACFVCLQTWFQKSPSRENMACFTCRQALDPAFLIELGLNTTLEDDETTEQGEDDEDGMDDLTRDWLEAQNAKNCPHCGVWITKDGGCNHMECICGYEFCWYCLRLEYDECDCEASDDETVGEEWQDEEVVFEPPEEEVVQEQEEEFSRMEEAVLPVAPTAEPDDIIVACKAGDLEQVQREIYRDRQLLMSEHKSRTPLYYASFCGHFRVIDFLLREGATDPDGICYLSALNEECRQRLRQGRSK